MFWQRGWSLSWAQVGWVTSTAQHSVIRLRGLTMKTQLKTGHSKPKIYKQKKKIYFQRSFIPLLKSSQVFLELISSGSLKNCIKMSCTGFKLSGCFPTNVKNLSKTWLYHWFHCVMNGAWRIFGVDADTDIREQVNSQWSVDGIHM